VNGRYAVEMLLLIERWLLPRLSTAATAFPRATQIEGWAEHLNILTLAMRDNVAGSSRADFSACAARLHRNLHSAAGATRKNGKGGTIPPVDRWRRHVEGPFNLFGVMDGLDASSAAVLLAQVRSDKSRLGVLIALHATLEGEVGRDAITEICQGRLDRAVRESEIDEALGWFERARWASRVPREPRQAS
jgi:hypothetical protein